MKIADNIIAAVCAEHGVSAEQLKQKGMYSRGISTARGDAINRLRNQSFSAGWIAIFLNMSRQGVSRHLYKNIQIDQATACRRYRERRAALQNGSREAAIG